mgnify:CR=1 FL=1
MQDCARWVEDENVIERVDRIRKRPNVTECSLERDLFLTLPMLLARYEEESIEHDENTENKSREQQDDSLARSEREYNHKTDDSMAGDRELLIDDVPRELHGTDDLGIIEFLTDIGDMHINGVGRIGEVRSVVFPDLLKDLLARDDSSAIAQQVAEERELLGRERYLRTSSRHPLGGEIDGEILDVDRLLGCLEFTTGMLSPGENIIHAQMELLEGERLDNVIVRAMRKTLKFVYRLVECCEKKIGRDVSSLLDHVDERQSIDRGNHAINDKKIELRALDFFVGTLPIMNSLDMPSFHPEIFGDIFRDRAIVFYDKESAHKETGLSCGVVRSRTDRAGLRIEHGNGSGRSKARSGGTSVNRSRRSTPGRRSGGDTMPFHRSIFIYVERVAHGHVADLVPIISYHLTISDDLIPAIERNDSRSSKRDCLVIGKCYDRAARGTDSTYRLRCRSGFDSATECIGTFIGRGWQQLGRVRRCRSGPKASGEHENRECKDRKTKKWKLGHGSGTNRVNSLRLYLKRE